MAKQLLRFALTRLDLLDEQTLDLENLDFALGRNTVLEFRDVGLVLQVRTM
jgi:autophagy-related protein 2